MAIGIPEGMQTITPILNVKGAVEAIDFLQRAFGAEVVRRVDLPDGSLGHAALKVGTSRLFVEEAVKNPATVSSFLLLFEDVDAAWARATAAGATVQVPLALQFWGARWGLVRDRWGNAWGLGTQVEDVSEEEMQKRVAARTSSGGPQD